MLQEAWLCEEAAIWQNVMKCEHRTGILSLSAVRAEQLFTLKFWCGILLKFLQQLYSDFCLSYATAITVLGTIWLLEFWVCSLSMLGVIPAEKLCLLKTAIKKKKKFGREILPISCSFASQKVFLWKKRNLKHACYVFRLLFLVGVCRLCCPADKLCFLLCPSWRGRGGFLCIFLVMFCL